MARAGSSRRGDEMGGSAMEDRDRDVAGVGAPLVPVDTRIVGGCRAAGGAIARPACLRCGSPDAMRLERASTNANTCYRCRECGHIFSPVGG